VRPQHHLTHPRVLHPGAWWLWALGLAAAASRTTNPVPLVLIIVVTWFVVQLRRGDNPWAASYAMFFRLALVVIAIHVVFQALLSSQAQGLTVLFTLPELTLPTSTGIKIGGQVTLEAVLNAVYYGLQLAAIFCCIGAANALGSARRLLRYMPAALYEIGIAAVIALTFAPQLVTDAARVRQAAKLRGSRRGVRQFGRLAMPIVEGALERSVDLAAAMDARGYGRTTAESPAARRVTAGLVLLGSFGLLVGVYGLLTAHGFGVPLLLLGGLLGVLGLRVGGRRSGRTRYRPDPWAVPELLAVSCGVVAATLMFFTASREPALLSLASPTDLPPVPLLACLGILVGVLPAFLTPPQPELSPVREDEPR
jgi:energy-coupling factor transport system permease protein